MPAARGRQIEAGALLSPFHDDASLTSYFRVARRKMSSPRQDVAANTSSMMKMPNNAAFNFTPRSIGRRVAQFLSIMPAFVVECNTDFMTPLFGCCISLIWSAFVEVATRLPSGRLRHHGHRRTATSARAISPIARFGAYYVPHIFTKTFSGPHGRDAYCRRLFEAAKCGAELSGGRLPRCIAAAFRLLLITCQ